MISKKLLKELYVNKGLKQREIAVLFNLSKWQVSQMLFRHKVIKKKQWSDEEDERLMEMYGVFPFETIAKELDRTSKSIRARKTLLDLGKATKANEFVTASDLANALGRNSSTIVNWIKKNELPASKKVATFTRRYYRINVNRFWKWAKENPKLMRWEKYERNSLGPEPEWIEEELKKIEYENTGKPWGTLENLYLIEDYKNNMALKELSKKYKRKPNTIDMHLKKLKVKRTRKIRIDWQPIEDETIIKLRKEGKTYSFIADELGRSTSMCINRHTRLKNKAINI